MTCNPSSPRPDEEARRQFWKLHMERSAELLEAMTRIPVRENRQGLVDDLVAIGRDMNERGWILKIEDGFRTRQMQTELGRKPAVFDMIVRSCWRTW